MLSDLSSECIHHSCMSGAPYKQRRCHIFSFIFELCNKTSETNRADVSEVAVDGCTGYALQHQLWLASSRAGHCTACANIEGVSESCCCCCQVTSVVSNSVRPHRQQPTRLPVPGILQAKTLEWVAISFSNVWKWKVKGNSLSRVRLLVTPWTASAHIS